MSRERMTAMAGPDAFALRKAMARHLLLESADWLARSAKPRDAGGVSGGGAS